jgi:regulator of protease activity HflC (stomatin/prohibitin superfamily)
LNGKVLASAITAGALSTPVAVAIADTNETNNELGAPDTPQLQVHRELRDQAHVKRTGSRDEARRELRAARRAKAARRARAKRKAEKTAAQRLATSAGGSTAAPHLQAIAACESGGNPSAVGGGGQFRGKYQFTYSTWSSVGGSGDPAAASEAEQDRRAAMLYASAGAGQWPVCGG